MGSNVLQKHPNLVMKLLKQNAIPLAVTGKLA
jgi:hypothetical protein